MRPAALLALVAALAVCPPAAAAPGKIAVGFPDGVPADAVASLAERLTGGAADEQLADLGALVVTVPDVEAATEALTGLTGVEYVEPVRRSRRLAFQPNDPLAFFQWYLNAIRAFEFWEVRPSIGPVRVAVIDSGIDASHPEFAGRIAATQSFVRGSKATVDTIGHGTVVAGQIAAAVDNAEGIAGVGFPVELLVAKVVTANGSISVEAEAAAIKWAVQNDAQVINLSLGGVRHPKDPTKDTYSALEQDAVDYAFENGAVVVAATGNCTACPYPYASYPAALPHVIGVSALDQSGKTPAFSNRDRVYNDLAAPGVGIISTFPRDLTDGNCAWPGYNLCALPGLQMSDGTSFSAPLASAAAALLLAQAPFGLTASQVMALLERTSVDLAAPGRDPLTGNGRLDIAAALNALALPPPADRFEVNDDAGSKAHTLYGSRPKINATIDFYDDPSDVYRVYLRAGRRVRVSLGGLGARKPTLVLWRPGTKHVTPVTAIAVRTGAVLAYRTARNPQLSHVPSRTGWHFVEVKAPKNGGGPYRLQIVKG